MGWMRTYKTAKTKRLSARSVGKWLLEICFKITLFSARDLLKRQPGTMSSKEDESQIMGEVSQKMNKFWLFQERDC